MDSAAEPNASLISILRLLVHLQREAGDGAGLEAGGFRGDRVLANRKQRNRILARFIGFGPFLQTGGSFLARMLACGTTAPVGSVTIPSKRALDS